MSLGDLVVNLRANTSQFATGIANSHSSILQFAETVKSMAEKAVTHLAAVGDKFDKMSLRTGATAEELSRLQFAAQQSGSGIEALEGGLNRMSAFMLNAERASKKLNTEQGRLGVAVNSDLSGAIGTMKQLGVTMDDLKNKTPAERLNVFAEAIKSIEDPTQRAALTMQVFGRSGTELLPMLLAGADGIAKLTAESDVLNNTVSTTQAVIGAELTDAMNRAAVASDGLWRMVGEKLGPAWIDWYDTMAQAYVVLADYADILVPLGSALLGAASAYVAVSIAVKAYTVLQIKALALSGPKGWLILAGAAAAAAAATWAMNKQLGDVQKKSDKAAQAKAQAALQAANLAKSLEHVGNSAKTAAEQIRHVESVANQLRTPAEKTAIAVRALKDALAQKGMVFEGHSMVQGLRESESGFTSTITSMADELAILRGEATETGLTLAKMLEHGVAPERIAELEAMFAERERILADREKEEENVANAKYWEDRVAAMQAEADAVAESLQTPSEKLAEEQRRLQRLVDADFLSTEQMQAALDKMREGIIDDEAKGQDKDSETEFATGMQANSDAAFSTVIKAMQSRSPELSELKKQTQHLAQLNKKNTEEGGGVKVEIRRAA